MKPVPHGEPYAGKLHVRFDEGAGVPHGASRSTLHPIETAPIETKKMRVSRPYITNLLSGGDTDLQHAQAAREVRIQDTVGIPRGGHAKRCMRPAAVALPRGRATALREEERCFN